MVVAVAMVTLAPSFRVSAAEPAAAGDLEAQARSAEGAREADPTPEHWRTEAEAKEALGDFGGALEAYRGELDALPEDAIDARRRSEADWERVREQARGRVEDEPTSTHRAELDGQWVPPAPPEQLRPAPRPQAEPVIEDSGDDDRIITKWYFWVTVAAITASAAAVAGIAIRAARDERDDVLDASALQPMGPTRPVGIRF